MIGYLFNKLLLNLVVRPNMKIAQMWVVAAQSWYSRVGTRVWQAEYLWAHNGPNGSGHPTLNNDVVYPTKSISNE